MSVRLFQTIRRGLDLLIWLLEALSTLALMFITFSFGWLVFGRYVLNSTPTWVEHVAILLITFITFSMMAVNQRRGTNLAVGAFTDRLPHRAQTVVLASVDLLVAVFGGYCLIYGIKLALFNADQRMLMLGISEGIRMIPLAMGGGVLALVALLNAIGRFLDPDGNDGGSDESAELDAAKLDLGVQ